MPETTSSVAQAFSKPEQERVFFQGDRAPDERISKAATDIAKLLKERGWEANVGAYGGFVQSVEESGIAIHPHTNASEKALRFDAQKTEAIDTVGMAKQILGKDASPEEIKEAAWGIRMALFLTTSEGHIFFPGTRGTRAHLLAAVAFNLVTDKPKPIALVGWEPGQPDLATTSESGLPEQEEAWAKIFAKESGRENPEWLKGFRIDQIEDVVDFVTNQELKQAR